MTTNTPSSPSAALHALTAPVSSSHPSGGSRPRLCKRMQILYTLYVHQCNQQVERLIAHLTLTHKSIAVECFYKCPHIPRTLVKTFGFGEGSNMELSATNPICVSLFSVMWWDNLSPYLNKYRDYFELQRIILSEHSGNLALQSSRSRFCRCNPQWVGRKWTIYTDDGHPVRCTTQFFSCVSPGH